MLRLTRKMGQGFSINEETYVWIVKSTSGRCEIAIDAPLSQNVRRCELPLQAREPSPVARSAHRVEVGGMHGAAVSAVSAVSAGSVVGVVE